MAGNRRTGAAAEPRTRAKAPLLLVAGVGMAAVAELRTVPLLARHFDVLVLRAGHPQEGWTRRGEKPMDDRARGGRMPVTAWVRRRAVVPGEEGTWHS